MKLLKAAVFFAISLVACYNGGEEGFNSLYDAANGSVNGGEYKVVWINLFTSW